MRQHENVLNKFKDISMPDTLGCNPYIIIAGFAKIAKQTRGNWWYSFMVSNAVVMEDTFYILARLTMETVHKTI